MSDHDPPPPLTALVAGATGLVGRELVAQLCAHPAYGRVLALVRPGAQLPAHPNLQLRPLDWDAFANAIPSSSDDTFRADHVYCALGTTRAAAGSAEAFRRVDYDYVLAVARHTVAQGAQRFAMVSAAGADAHSRLLYSRTKGEIEAAVRGQHFSAHLIARPGLLLGPRREHRLGERIAIQVARVLDPLMRGPLARYRSIPAADVARALLHASLWAPNGVHLYEGAALRAMANAQTLPGAKA